MKTDPNGDAMSDEAATRPPHLNELYLQGDDDRQAHVGCPVGLGGTPDGDWFEPVKTLGEAIEAGGRHLKLHHANADEPVRAIVLGGCGHWWRESRPANVKIRPDQPRVCTGCKPDHPAAVGTSPQGMAMVRVTYLPDAGREALP